MMHKKHWLLLLAAPALAIAYYCWNPFTLEEDALKATASAILMIFLWISEVLPMPVVALLPLLLFPSLGISSIESCAQAYSNPVVFLFMGGFIIGLAIEKWNLHRRIALRIVSITGTSGDRIILGFILATGFLSMWLSNTATTMMMFPIALSVISVLAQHDENEKSFRNFSLVLMLVLAYASNIGGMATLIGTPPNVAFNSLYEKQYGHPITFFDWMLVCMPLSLLLLLSLYLILTKVLFPNQIKANSETGDFIRHQLNEMGKLTGPEKKVLIVFVATASCWVFRGFINELLPFKLDDNMIAMAGALSLFAIPAGHDEAGKSLMLMRWSDTSKMGWGILLLFGGGIALATSLEKAGVMSMIGTWIAQFSGMHGLLLVLIVVVVSIFLSEVMSNIAQVIVLTPVLAALSDSLHMDPLLLGIPMTLAASAAGMLPMGTPPNAIVFSSGHIQLKDMLKAGLVMNLISILLITLFGWFVIPLVMPH